MVALAVAGAALCAAPVFGVPASVSPTLPPHVATATETDVCAMCHRAHTAASDATWDSPVVPGLSGSALLAVGSTGGDKDMCYVCHGVDTLGSGTDVQNSFEATSAHSLNPTSSPYGRSPKQCSTCHDSHGSARITTGTPFPALLRAVTSTGTPVYRGNEICATCHVPRTGSSFEGIAVFAQTAHARIATPASGTGIVCDACHDPHGSPVAPMIRTQLATPSAPATAAVVANDRTLCLGCHGESLGIWSGAATYAASHASSSATVTIPGEWPAAGASRRVGECQVCHSPTGSLDASGVLIPTMLGQTQPSLCYACHRVGGSAASNLASGAYSPTTPGAELLASFAGEAVSGAYGRLQVYSRETTAAGLPVGPQEPTGLGTPGALAYGDVDGLGVSEVIVADSGSARVALVGADVLRTVGVRVLPVLHTPAFIAVGDVFVDGTMLPELVVVSASGLVDVMRYSGGAFVTVATTSITGVPTGLAVGDVAGSDGAADIAITTSGVDTGLWILTESGGASLQSIGGASPFSTIATPVACAVGDVQPGGAKPEVAVATTGGTNNAVQVFNGAGTSLLTTGTVPAGAVTAITAGDILTGVAPASTSGDEIALAYASVEGSSGVLVFPQVTGGGLGTPLDAALPGIRKNPSSLSLGDVDGDGVRELAVALAGRFLRSSSSVAPAVTILSPNAGGTDLTVPATSTFPAGGVELSGASPFVLVADIGAVGPSRHATVETSHVPTETAVSTLHVICSDCHDSHLAAPSASSTADLPGELFGSRGVIPANGSGTVTLSAVTTATAEYQVCFKCHAGQDPQAAYSLASLVSTTGASSHPIESTLATSTNASGTVLVTGTALKLRCTSCHGTALAAPAPRGPHSSPEAPLLVKPALGTTPSNPALLCYSCHLVQIYSTGASDGVAPDRSGFYDSDALTDEKKRLHSYHTAQGMGCGSCHVSHGSTTLPHILRAQGFSWLGPDATTDGSCATNCHTGAVRYGYKR